MNLRVKNINLLVVFSVIWDERNLTRAAERLSLSQSAVSHSLKKLRDDFNDPLFIKNSKGVIPTDFAISLNQKISPLIRDLETVYFKKKSFDLKTIEKKIYLASGDYFAMTKLGPFVEQLSVVAPGVRMIIQPIANVYNELMFERGEIDLAITAISLDLKSKFYSKEIFSEKMVCCTRKKHPIMKGEIGTEKYLQADHVNVSNFGKEFGAADHLLKRTKKVRKVHTVVSSFYDAASLVQKSDLVLTAPQGICSRLGELYGLKVHDLSFMKAPRPVSLIWHERTHEDPFHKAIRSMLATL